MSLRILKKRSLIVLAASLLTACVQTQERINEGAAGGIRITDERAPNARLNLDTVAILDKSLQNDRSGKLAIEASGARRTATNTLEVYATIRNRTDFPLVIEGRVQFFDSQKVPVEGPSAWQKVFLDPNGITAYKGLSTQIDVAHYYVELREAR
ncbi:MAG: hypothetical protein V4709_15035 [Pseudomonadota bacterium]